MSAPFSKESCETSCGFYAQCKSVANYRKADTGDIPYDPTALPKIRIPNNAGGRQSGEIYTPLDVQRSRDFNKNAEIEQSPSISQIHTANRLLEYSYHCNPERPGDVRTCAILGAISLYDRIGSADKYQQDIVSLPSARPIIK